MTHKETRTLIHIRNTKINYKTKKNNNRYIFKCIDHEEKYREEEQPSLFGCKP